jgi:IS4 transposase
MRMLEQIPLCPGAHYVMDRGYMDFARLFHLHRHGVYFVVRCKEPVRFKVWHRRAVNRVAGLRCDQTVRLSSSWSKNSYPEPMRKIRFFDQEHQVMLVLLTNNLEAAPEVITELYRRRWQVELFFKWMKQHLRLRAFYGRSQNAVRCQIWCALCAYLMVAILKKQARIEKSLNDMVRICSVNIFSQEPPAEIFAHKITPQTSTQETYAFQNTLPL